MIATEDDSSFYSPLLDGARPDEEGRQVGLEAFMICICASFFCALFLVHAWLEFGARY